MDTISLRNDSLIFPYSAIISSTNGRIYIGIENKLNIGLPTIDKADGYQLMSPLDNNTQGETEWGTQTVCYSAYRETFINGNTSSSLPLFSGMNVWGVAYSPELDITVCVNTPDVINNTYYSNDNMVSWTPSFMLNGGVLVTDIEWSPELSIFCSVSVQGTTRSHTSSDGMNWTSTNIDTSSDWYSIVWSPELGIFCTVSTLGTYSCAVSSDGVNWTTGNIDTPNSSWIRVCWSPELMLFCATALSGNNRVATSPDGLNWDIRSIGTTNQLRGVAWSYTLGIFCVISLQRSNQVWISSDGVTWTMVNNDIGDSTNNLFWCPYNNCFVAGADRFNYSYDGINWSFTDTLTQNVDYRCFINLPSGRVAAFCTLGSNRCHYFDTL